MPLGLITFHHFYSKQKLSVLRVLASAHSLQGLFQRGRPGVLLVSGADAASVARCVAAVKRMRWQRVEVRGVAPELRLAMRPERTGLVEVHGRVRDVVAAAGEYGGAEAEKWVKVRMGFCAE